MARRHAKSKTGRKQRRPTKLQAPDLPAVALAPTADTAEPVLPCSRLGHSLAQAANGLCPALERMRLARSDSADAISAERGRPPRGVLVVGMGDQDRGDGGVGVHLIGWLAQLNWPESVVFCQADETVPNRAQDFARVILLDAIEGSESPGTLYEADPEELLARSVGGAGSGLGLLGMLPKTVLKRISIFGIQPATTTWGDTLSREVISCMPMVMPYLRAHILKAADEARAIN